MGECSWKFLPRCSNGRLGRRRPKLFNSPPFVRFFFPALYRKLIISESNEIFTGILTQWKWIIAFHSFFYCEKRLAVAFMIVVRGARWKINFNKKKKIHWSEIEESVRRRPSITRRKQTGERATENSILMTFGFCNYVSATNECRLSRE